MNRQAFLYHQNTFPDEKTTSTPRSFRAALQCCGPGTTGAASLQIPGCGAQQHQPTLHQHQHAPAHWAAPLRGTPAYVETHNVTTSDLGVFNLNIGQGAPVSGSFAGINWGASEYFLRIEMSLDNGFTYTTMGVSPLLSVPYALYAAQAGSGAGGIDDSPTNELQTIILNGDTLVLSQGGGSIVPPWARKVRRGSRGPLARKAHKDCKAPPGPQGQQGNPGPQGTPGTGITLLGTVPTVANLPTAGANVGDLFIVSATGIGYAWNGTMWVQAGPIQVQPGRKVSPGRRGLWAQPGRKALRAQPGRQGPGGPAGPQGLTGKWANRPTRHNRPPPARKAHRVMMARRELPALPVLRDQPARPVRQVRKV